jgi:hypothetical protein
MNIAAIGQIRAEAIDDQRLDIAGRDPAAAELRG